MRANPSAVFAGDVREDSDQRGARCRWRFAESLATAAFSEAPFPHYSLTDTLPPAVVAELAALPLDPPELGGRSGTRELHNDQRRYLDPARIAGSPVCAEVAGAFQDPRTVGLIEARLGVDLSGCHLRIEYAQDSDGFWLAPHTDLGVKRFTLLCYLGPEDRPDLGTDLYSAADAWALRSPFGPGLALAFAPSDRSWHGFEPRAFGSVRKSLIVNYVTSQWRAREQLAFPDQPVAST